MKGRRVTILVCSMTVCVCVLIVLHRMHSPGPPARHFASTVFMSERGLRLQGVFDGISPDPANDIDRIPPPRIPSCPSTGVPALLKSFLGLFEKTVEAQGGGYTTGCGATGKAETMSISNCTYPCEGTTTGIDFLGTDSWTSYRYIGTVGCNGTGCTVQCTEATQSFCNEGTCPATCSDASACGQYACVGEPGSMTCGGCAGNDQCGGSKYGPVCDIPSGTCGCVTAADCPAGQGCVSGACGQCNSDADCAGNSNGRACYAPEGGGNSVCVQCTASNTSCLHRRHTLLQHEQREMLYQRR